MFLAQQLGKCQAVTEIGSLYGCLDVLLKSVPMLPLRHQMARRAKNLILVTQCLNDGGKPLQKKKSPRATQSAALFPPYHTLVQNAVPLGS